MVSHKRNIYNLLPANAAAFILLFAPFTAAAITTDYSSSNTRLNQELAVIYKSRSARNDETLTKNVCAGWCQAYPGCTAYSYYFRAIDKFAECKIGPSSTSTKQRTGATVYSILRMNLFGGEVCELQKQCNTSSMMSCVNNVCTCPSTHTLAMDGQQCLPLVGFNESCKEQQQCPTSSSCLSALCQCDPGTTLFYGELPCVDSSMYQYSIGPGPAVLSHPSPRMNYTENSMIWWCIKAPTGMKIRINVTYWSVESCCDYLDVYTGCDPGREYTSGLEALNANAVINTNLMGLLFYSDESVNGYGFDVTMVPL